MIVKNEQKYLHEVLTAIRPLLEQLDAELIIGDTGSTDDTVAISKEFTNKVIHIKWENDFAHARNKVLDHARGKWLMSLDGDEVLQDCSEIIKFFNSGEYKKYASADIQWKNIIPSSDGVDRFYDFTMRRFYKITKNTRWVGKIHEYIDQIYPIKYLTTEAIHYGYYFETEESKNNKLHRNLGPLLEMHKEDPNSTRTLSQIASTYMALNRHKEALPYINLGLEFYKKNPKQMDVFFDIHKQYYCECNFTLNNFDEVVTATKAYFKEAPALMDNAYMYKFLEGSALSALKRFDEAIEANIQAIKYWDLMEKGKLNKRIWEFLVLGGHHRDIILKDIVRDSSRIGNFELALKWQKELPNYEESKKRDVFVLYAESVMDSPPEKLGTIGKIYEYATKHFKQDTEDYNMAINLLESYIKTPIVKVEVSNYIVKQKNIPETDYFRLQQLRTYYMDGIRETPPALDYFLKSDKQYNQIFGDVVFASMEYKQDFAKFMNNLVIDDTKKFAGLFVTTNDDVANVCIDYLKQVPLQSTSNSLAVLEILSEILFLLVSSEHEKGVKNSNSRYYTLLELYITMKHRYLKLHLGDTAYNDNTTSTLPEQDRFTYFLGNAYEAKTNGDNTKYVSELKKSQNIIPNMKTTIEQLLTIAEKEAPVTSGQLETEIAKLKSAIYALIYTGNNKKASEVLDSYEKMNPTDPDISVIRGMVEN